MVFDTLVLILVVGLFFLAMWGLVGLFRRTGDLPTKPPRWMR